MPTISGIIITRDEEARIGACLESLKWLDEIIVVDSGSTDRTEDICRRYPSVCFVRHDWEGFGRQKNIALGLARGEWVLSVDADELISGQLADEITKVVGNAGFNGYMIKRKNFYRGRWVRHSGWWPDHVLRFFRKDKGRFSDRPVHESVELDGAYGFLEGCIEHHSFNCVDDFIRKAQSYSTIGARLMYERGRRPSAFGAVARSVATFCKLYFLKLGFLDGYAGLLIAFSNAAGVFYRYMKCIELQNEDHD